MLTVQDLKAANNSNIRQKIAPNSITPSILADRLDELADNLGGVASISNSITNFKKSGNTIYDVICQYTGEYFTVKEATVKPDGVSLTDADVDNVVYFKIGGKYHKRKFDYITPEMFGAKGNALYVDTNASSPTFQRPFVDASFTIPANDDTTAFRRAIKFINDNSARLTYKNGGAIGGHLGGRYKLVLQKAFYYITDSKVITSSGLGGGANAGFVIEGAGQKNSIIVYSNANEGSDDYLFYDNNQFPDMTFKGFRVDCITGKEKIFYQSSTGNSQNWNLSHLELNGFKRGIDISGFFNADKNSYTRIKGISYVAGCSFFRNIDNPQSVGHSFFGCDTSITGVGSVVFAVNAGSISIFGGSHTVYQGATLYKVSTNSSLLASWAVAIASFGSRLEVQQNSKYIDINIGQVLITGEDCTNFPESDGGAKIIIRRNGSVKFDRCSIGNPVKIAFEVLNGSSFQEDAKPSVEFLNCILPNNNFSSECAENYNDYNAYEAARLINPNTTTGKASEFFPNLSGYGRVIFKNCTTVTNETNTFNDGSPFANLGYSSRTYEKRYAIVRAHPAEKWGLPPTAGGGIGAPITATAKIPLGCTVVRVGIVKGYTAQDGFGINQKWRIKDGYNTDLVEITVPNMYSILSSFSPDIWKRTYDDNSRTFTLYPDAGNNNVGGEGYMVIEYI